MSFTDDDVKRLKERFWKKVHKTDSCWLWIGAKRHRGYGDAWWNGRHFAAHRLTYSWAIGPIPDGETIDHKCGVTACVNPKHLQTMPMVDNSRLGSPAQNTLCPKGHEFEGQNVIWIKDAKGRMSRMCRICKRNCDKRQWLKHGTQYRARKRLQYVRDKDKILAKQRAYYEKNKERIMERQMAYQKRKRETWRKSAGRDTPKEGR